MVGDTNLITVDLSPMKDGLWGDCARSFCVENGRWAPTPTSRDLQRGIEVEIALHAAMRTFVTPNTTFQELFDFANREIERHGFENLDFLGNVGHSIESSREARRYVEAGNRLPLIDAGLFTFEPHLRTRSGVWGFKHENIYFFDDKGGVVAEPPLEAIVTSASGRRLPIPLS